MSMSKISKGWASKKESNIKGEPGHSAQYGFSVILILKGLFVVLKSESGTILGQLEHSFIDICGYLGGKLYRFTCHLGG